MQSTAEVEVVEPAGAPVFHALLYLALAAYAACRCVTFVGPLVIGGPGGQVPPIIMSTLSLQVWATLWAGGALLHLAAIRWEWAARATIWTFALKGLAVAAAFVLSAVVADTAILPSLAGLLSYGTPVVLLLLIQWQSVLRRMVVVQAVPTVEASTVAEAARERLKADTGEVPEVAHD